MLLVGEFFVFRAGLCLRSTREGLGDIGNVDPDQDKEFQKTQGC